MGRYIHRVMLATLAFVSLLLVNTAPAQSLFPQPSTPFPLAILISLSIVALILVAAIGAGSAILHLATIKLPRRRYAYFIASVLGIGVIAQLMVPLGLLGLFRRWVLFVLVIITILITHRFIVRFFRDIACFATGRLTISYRLTDIVLLILLLACCLTYFSLSLLPPVSYDVLEYHLAVPKDFLRAGGIIAEPYNFFGNLALHVEMLYTLGMSLEASLLNYTPKLLNFSLLLFSLFGVYLIMEFIGIPRLLRFIGCLLFLLNPLIWKTSLDAFSDLGVCLYVLTAIFVWLLFAQSRDKKHFYLIAVFLGFALSCKYTVFPLYVIPFLCILLPAALSMLSNDKPSHPPRILLSAVLFLVSILLIFSPWLIKNVLLLGNPFYPFFHTLFPSPYWSPAQSDLLFRVHHPQSLLSFGFAKSLISRGASIGWLYFVAPLLVPLLARKKNTWAILLFAFFFVSYAIWNYLAASADRFLSALIPISILLIIWSLRQLLQRYKMLTIVVLVVASPLIALSLKSSLAFLLPQAIIPAAAPGEKYFFDVHPALAQAAAAANRLVPPGSRLLLIYEARSYPFLPPTASNTVFDKSILLQVAAQSRSANDMLMTLRQQGFTHCLVNEFELVRLITFYGSREKLRSRNVEQYLDDPGVLVHFREFYPPFDRSPDFAFNAAKIDEFFHTLDGRVLFQLKSSDGRRIFIASLEPDQ